MESGDQGEAPDYDSKTTKGQSRLKIICLGDSAVGKSKLVERFLMNNFQCHELSTYALSLFRHETKVDGEEMVVDIWDTGGQERFSKMHPSYYFKASGCIMVFDATRKITYKNLQNWYDELRSIRPDIPCLVAINKIEQIPDIKKQKFKFASKHSLPMYYVSAATGENVVKLFNDAISMGKKFRDNPDKDFTDQMMAELELMQNEENKNMEDDTTST